MTAPIPAGYQLHISSWENDADDYRTEVLSGLTREDVAFLVSIIKQFSSRNKKPKGIGNTSIGDVPLIKLVLKALDNHPNISPDLRSCWTLDLPCAVEDLDEFDGDEELAEASEQAYEKLCELIGSPVSEFYQDELNFCRVYEDHKVFLITAPVENVTHEFL